MSHVEHPREGGCYVRDPKDGTLKRVETEPAPAEAPHTAQSAKRPTRAKE